MHGSSRNPYFSCNSKNRGSSIFNKPFDNNVIILEPWSWVNTKYVFEIQGNKKVVKIEIDPSKRLEDINQNKKILEFLE